MLLFTVMLGLSSQEANAITALWMNLLSRYLRTTSTHRVSPTVKFSTFKPPNNGEPNLYSQLLTIPSNKASALENGGSKMNLHSQEKAYP